MRDQAWEFSFSCAVSARHNAKIWKEEGETGNPRRVLLNRTILNYANACNQRLSNNSNNTAEGGTTKQKASAENDCDMKNMPAILAYKSFASADQIPLPQPPSTPACPPVPSWSCTHTHTATHAQQQYTDSFQSKPLRQNKAKKSVSHDTLSTAEWKLQQIYSQLL